MFSTLECLKYVFCSFLVFIPDFGVAQLGTILATILKYASTKFGVTTELKALKCDVSMLSFLWLLNNFYSQCCRISFAVVASVSLLFRPLLILSSLIS